MRSIPNATNTYQRFSYVLLACVMLLFISGCKPRPEVVSPGAFSERYPAAEDRLAPDGARIGAPESPVLSGTTVKVGLLLPLSGRHADLGRALQNAATMALFDKYASLSPQMAATKVELVAEDSGDTAESARRATRALLDEDVALIIGPVFGEMLPEVASIAKTKEVPVISFSNNREVAGPGAYIFGFSPEAQAERIVRFAQGNGKQKFAILSPDSAYGKSVRQAANRVANEAQEPVIVQAEYAAQGVGIEKAMARILPAAEQGSFSALFFPESGKPLEIILRTLDAKNLRAPTTGLQLLGTGLWDDRNLIRRVNLEGAWLATSPPNLTQAFERRFNNTYRYMPPRIASLAYDAVSLAVTLATSGRGLTNETLTHTGGFSGPANGIFRFHPDGTSERGLAVIQVSGTGFQILSPAPTNFR